MARWHRGEPERSIYGTQLRTPGVAIRGWGAVGTDTAVDERINGKIDRVPRPRCDYRLIRCLVMLFYVFLVDIFTGGGGGGAGAAVLTDYTVIDEIK